MRRSPQDQPYLNPLSNRLTRSMGASTGSSFGQGKAADGLASVGPGERNRGLAERLETAENRLAGLPGSEAGKTHPTVPTSSLPVATGSRQAEAVTVLETIQRLADQSIAQGRNRLALTLRLEGGGSIRIRLVREGGEIHTHLNTDVPGLEAVFRQQWTHFSQDAGERGFKFQSLTFNDPDGSLGDGRSSQGRREDTPAFDREIPSFATPVAGGTAQTSTPQQQAGRMPAPATPSGSGRLRAWV